MMHSETIVKRLSRLLLTLALLALPGAALWAQTTVPATPNNCNQLNWNGGDEDWDNEDEAENQDDTGATVDVNDGEESEYLRCTGYGFSIPTGAIINGITVTIRRRVSSTGGGSSVDDLSVRLVKANAVTGSNYASGTDYTTAWVDASYGGTTDLWGTTWTPAEINAADFGVAFATHKVNNASGIRTVSVDVIRVAVTYTFNSGGVASGFAVIDEAYGTPPIAVANYLTGRIYTKVAGIPFRLNIAAINNNQIRTNYVPFFGSRNVAVKLVDNSDGVCVLNSTQANHCSAACRAKPAVSGGSQTLTFVSSDAGQRQSADFTIPGAWSNLAAIVSDVTTTACSIDAFAVRPQVFDSISITANNPGTPPLRASTDTFTMTVRTPTDGYAGAAALPTINPAGVAADAAGWTVGTISPGSFPAATSPGTDSSATGTTFTYSEVGHFRLLGYDPATNSASPRGIYDSTWTTVDQDTSTSDCIPGNYSNTKDANGKYGCLFGLGANSALFGRFIPDRFVLTSGSVTPACNDSNPATRDFTYMGQARLGMAYRLEARNGADGITQNYDAARVAVIAPTVVAEDQDAAHQSCNLAGRLTGLPTATWTAGVYNASGSSAVFSRPATAAPGTLNASTAALCTATLANAGNPFWTMDIGVLVSDGTASMADANMNAGTTGVCSGTGCNAIRLGNTGMVLGRLNLLNAYGSDALPLLVPVRVEYWNGSSWQLNTEDRCTTLSASNLAVGNIVSSSGLNVTSASLALSPSATMSGGLTNFRINPADKGPGSVDVVLNLGLGVDSNTDWCGAWNSGPASGTGTAPLPDLSFLAAQWCGANADRAPAARLRFGSPRTPFIYLRERY